MSLIFDIFMTIIIIIHIIIDYYYAFFLISRIFVILIEWSLFTVLMIYKTKELNHYLRK